MQPLLSGFVFQVAGVMLWQVVFSHWVSGCVWVPGYVAWEFEGPGEQVGGKRGTAGVHGRSPPPGVSPCVFLLPCHHPAHLTSLV
jgi:hypothetical protein